MPCRRLGLPFLCNCRFLEVSNTIPKLMGRSNGLIKHVLNNKDST